MILMQKQRDQNVCRSATNDSDSFRLSLVSPKRLSKVSSFKCTYLQVDEVAIAPEFFADDEAR